MNRPKIFAVSMEPPRMPGSGGEVRTYFFIRMLAQLGELTLISLGGPAGDRKVNDDIAEMCSRVIEPDDGWQQHIRPAKPNTRLRAWSRSLAVLLMPWRDNWREFYRYCLQYLQSDVDNAQLSLGKRVLRSALRTQFRMGARFGLMPSRSVFVYSEQFDTVKKDAAQALGSEKFDLVWYEHTITYPFAASLINAVSPTPRPRLVCNAHNIESSLHDRIGSVAADAWQSEFSGLQARLLEKLERQQFNDCDLVFTCSEDDSVLGREMAPKTDFVVVGNGVDTEYFRPPEQECRADKPTLLFTGTFGYGPNRDGLKYFVEEIFPLIKRANPETEFIFAGYEAQRAYDELSIDDGQIRCVCSPPDIRPCFHKAWVFVVPLRAGSGTRLKILEAMSMQCPIVSTNLGAEGISGDDGVHFLLADTAEKFADQTIRLLADQNLRRRIQSESKTWVEQHYDWKMLCDQATTHLRRLVVRPEDE